MSGGRPLDRLSFCARASLLMRLRGNGEGVDLPWRFFYMADIGRYIVSSNYQLCFVSLSFPMANLFRVYFEFCSSPRISKKDSFRARRFGIDLVVFHVNPVCYEVTEKISIKKNMVHASNGFSAACARIDRRGLQLQEIGQGSVAPHRGRAANQSLITISLGPDMAYLGVYSTDQERRLNRRQAIDFL
jgi:hypothetical protein